MGNFYEKRWSLGKLWEGNLYTDKILCKIYKLMNIDIENYIAIFFAVVL